MRGEYSGRAGRACKQGGLPRVAVAGGAELHMFHAHDTLLTTTCAHACNNRSFVEIKSKRRHVVQRRRRHDERCEDQPAHDPGQKGLFYHHHLLPPYNRDVSAFYLTAPYIDVNCSTTAL